MLDAKFFGYDFCIFATATGNRHDLSAHAIAKTRDLRGPGKPGPNNPDSYWCGFHGVILTINHTEVVTPKISFLGNASDSIRFLSNSRERFQSPSFLSHASGTQ